MLILFKIASCYTLKTDLTQAMIQVNNLVVFFFVFFWFLFWGGGGVLDIDSLNDLDINLDLKS